MKLLVLTSEPISAGQLRQAVPADVDPEHAEVMVVAPAVQENPIKFWLSDADDAIARAQRVREETVQKLGAEGVSASADIGESDPFQAIQDALITFDADRIVVFTRGDAETGYREDIDALEVQERFGRPVDQATLAA
jgi:nucleotide-binding universal stress UspA family protein